MLQPKVLLFFFYFLKFAGFLRNKITFILHLTKYHPSQARANLKAADELPGRIGFLGLGIMGSPMAQNLIKAGCDVTVWNRTKSKCDALINLGAKYKPSPEEVAASCDVTFAMLADPESAVH
ncbi:hypothetical protein SLEP1_g21396 [Rubroshorea leprosula]|uniref:6-phosphogluconate dehydrogenase NADP-binding domain-containing protein n=1 Tax=Rubroshorea leprosula TaxID=152421 RepID=A0AAV5JF25_9ROSI|nr:hypothetical protein SLEP1_g21396 [Rubroshorea leprosula]